MKNKTTKPNPLKVFNDNNAKARMKAGGVMKSYKKTLKKAQDGMIQGPLTEKDQKAAEGFLNRTLETASPSTLKNYPPDKIPSRLNSLYQGIREQPNFNTAAVANKFPYGQTDNWQGIPYVAPGMKKGGAVKRKKK
jgi:hypothetical protein